MKARFLKSAAIVLTAMVFGVLPGCVEVWLLNLATPFLLNQ